MTPLARRIVAAVGGTLVLAVVVLAMSLSLGPTARAGLLLLGAGLVVVGIITAMLLRWFRKEIAETNRSSAVDVHAEAGVDPEALDDRPSRRSDEAPPEAGPSARDGARGDAGEDGPRDALDSK